MDFIFQGFQAALPLWIYVLTFACTLLLSWWAYSAVKNIVPKYRYVLVTLRALTFAILLLLLINPYIKSETSFFELSKIVVMLDNSSSTQISKNDYQGAKSYNEVLSTLDFGDIDAVNFSFFSFGRSANTSAPDSLTFDEGQTDVSAAIEAIKNNQQESKAAILISDGIYTKGKNPIYELEDLNVPVFTIGLGDTTFQQDVLVANVLTNKSGYLNTDQPVTVTVNSKGFEGVSIPIELKKGEQVLATQTIVPQARNNSQEVRFDLSLDEQGLQQYEINIPALQEEWTQANNSHRFAVDVQDAKQRVLSLAFEIHPDIRFVRSLLHADENTMLTARTWLGANQFIEGNFTVEPDSIDLVLIHGYPGTGLPQAIKRSLQKLVEEVPFILSITPNFDARSFERDITALPVHQSGTLAYSPMVLQVNKANTAHPILELPPVSFSNLPELFLPTQLTTTPGAQALFNGIYQGEATESPAITVQELGNKRKTLISAFNWYQWQQSPNEQVRQYVMQLWQNIISWTATDPDNKLLDIAPRRTTFSGSETITFDAFLKNERGENEPNASITLTLSSDTFQDRSYSMEALGAGDYRLELTSLPEGLYSYEASAQKGDWILDTQNGEFSVRASTVEFINTNRNDQFLGQLAQVTNGKYLPFDSLDGFWNNFRERGLFEQEQKVQTDLFYLYQHLGWFIVVLVLLCSEWILRKYVSLP